MEIQMTHNSPLLPSYHQHPSLNHRSPGHPLPSTDTITYYFENFPPNWNAHELHLLFSKQASIRHVHVSPCLNTKGQHFGFVTVKHNPTLPYLLQWFHSFWIGSYKLRFNEATHQCPCSLQHLKLPQTPPKPLHPLKTRDTRSFSKVTKGILGPPLCAILHSSPTSQMPKEVHYNLKPPNMLFSAMKDSIKWLKKCAVGVLSNPENLLSIEEDLTSNGVIDISITPIGGNLALLYFKAAEIMISFIFEAKNWLSK